MGDPYEALMPADREYHPQWQSHTVVEPFGAAESGQRLPRRHQDEQL